MSFLAEEFENLLAEKNLRPVDVARISGIPDAALSRLRSGAQSYMSAEYLEKIAAAIDKSPVVHARLLRARLLDECSGPGSDLIQIEIKSAKAPALRDEPADYGVKLPPKIEAAMKAIAAHVTKDTELKSIILSLGNLYASGRLSS